MSKPLFAYAKINARIMPVTRGERFEDPLSAELERRSWGEIGGGGTMQAKDGEVEFCGLDIDLVETEKSIPFICEFLTQCGAPKGSSLEYKENGAKKALPFGNAEGLAVYLNGTDLPINVYKECDVNVVCKTLNKLLGKDLLYESDWQGPRETALYYYGTSFITMRQAIMTFVDEYPLCQRCRIVQVA